MFALWHGCQGTLLLVVVGMHLLLTEHSMLAARCMIDRLDSKQGSCSSVIMLASISSSIVQ
jgi:hypothetical protein